MSWSLAASVVALAIPLSFGIAALRSRRSTPFASASAASIIAAALALAFTVLTVVASGASGAAGGAPESATALPWLAALVRVDGVTCAMLLLVAALGWVIVRYSRTYLAGDPGQHRYARWLAATLGAVTALVITNHLLVLALAWTLTSLALHKLLTFYRERPTALVAAHKKFLVSRLADLCLWSALALIYSSVGSLRLDVLAAWVATHAALPPSLQLAALLCVLAAALKSAQLPFHGWLLQVMEAPTPVSALLHAGVVNLGGFLMIRLSPMMAQAPSAQLLLVVVGLTTTVLAALIMTTRVSVKVALAWSTCAQMGFMLVQCGLGAWHLALLHLLAHSLYKAHAFLSAGSAVQVWQVAAQTRRAPVLSLGRLAVSAVVVLGVAAAAVALSAALAPGRAVPPSVPALAFLVGLALIPTVARGAGSLGAMAARAGAIALLYVGWHLLAAQLWPALVREGDAALGWGLVVVGFAALFAAQAMLRLRRPGRFTRALHTRLFAGFYLDERFTRLTFRVWPPRLPAPAAPRRSPPITAAESPS